MTWIGKSEAFFVTNIQHVWQMEIRGITSRRPPSCARGLAFSIKTSFSLSIIFFGQLLFCSSSLQMNITKNPSVNSNPPSENSPREVGITALNEENICREYREVQPLIPRSELIAIQGLRSEILSNFGSHVSRSEFIASMRPANHVQFANWSFLDWMSEPSECLLPRYHTRWNSPLALVGVVADHSRWYAADLNRKIENCFEAYAGTATGKTRLSKLNLCRFPLDRALLSWILVAIIIQFGRIVVFSVNFHTLDFWLK